ncbi:tryptophan halogenase family protein [Sphingomonas xanthus]|uniref:Tryptophan 7-halogenase n=1 Tax=Sphingomonas xanthus TaxID=2594473 RepID=A0A516IU92_9SPHN|nr:tryptophan halogenase family protein [Sphingomonas xanthus]QDP20429.1 tryptophan 7-halogenase [Sphingomonas xanthus]
MSIDAFPQHLVILGGGSAGWMAASYLDRVFNRPDRRRLRITLIESPNIGRIGVGEATIPTLLRFAQFLGIDEATLMKRTHATFKHGVRFIDWNGPDSDYFHPFEALDTTRNFNPAPSWLARSAAGVAGPFDMESGIQRQVAIANRAPKRMMDPDYQGSLPYAYHLDAEEFGDLLADIARSRGVSHVSGRVSEVEHSDCGNVKSLVLDDGRQIEGDLFIDCSGFASVLLGKAMEVPFESFSEHLLCDRAVAIPKPYADGEVARPYTTAKAMDFGWAWRIGLQHREGTGYVYSSKFIEPADAERALREWVGVAEDVPARHLAMRVGMPAETWRGNVIGIGLAGGFIEPLESTGLQLVELALEQLVRYFPLSGINPAARSRFNHVMRTRYLELRDFIVAHYCLTKRSDTPFWQAVTDPAHIPPSVASKLALWNDRHPSDDDNEYTKMLFGHFNWAAVYYGMGGATTDAMRNAAAWCPNPGAHLAELAATANHLIAVLPDHALWLEGLKTIPAKEWAA